MPITLTHIQSIEQQLLAILSAFNTEHLHQTLCSPAPSFLSHQLIPLSHSSYRITISLTFQPPAWRDIAHHYPFLQTPDTLQYAQNHRPPRKTAYSDQELDDFEQDAPSKPHCLSFFHLPPISLPIIVHTITDPSCNPIPTLHSCLLNLLNSITSWSTSAVNTLLNTPTDTPLPPYSYSHIHPRHTPTAQLYQHALPLAPLLTFHTPQSLNPLQYISTNQPVPEYPYSKVFSTLNFASREPNPLLNFVYSFSFDQRYLKDTPELTEPFLHTSHYALVFQQTILNNTPNPSLTLYTHSGNYGNYHTESSTSPNFTTAQQKPTPIAPLFDFPRNFIPSQYT